MDFNQCFKAYDTLDGANCQTVFPRRMTQREAALEAVQAVGLRQTKDIDFSIFEDWKNEAIMFQHRLQELKKADKK